jgi:riboflavin synthase
MFTGIIQDIGKILTISKHQGGDIEITVLTNNLQNFNLGDSIATNGVCLTITEIDEKKLKFYLSNETLNCSNFKNISINDYVNLEPSLKLSDGLSGHLVSGHVDFVSEILNINKIAESYEFQISIPKESKLFFIDKGSVTINGISLTVNKVLEDSISINIIPHTFDHTTFKYAKVGDNVNIEIDMVAKYIVGAGDVYRK